MSRPPSRTKKRRKRKPAARRKRPSIFGVGPLLSFAVVTALVIFLPQYLKDRPFRNILNATRHLGRGGPTGSNRSVGVKPKLLIVNAGGNHVDKFHSQLPTPLRARNSAEVGTVVRLVKSTKWVEAYYTPDQREVQKVEAEVRNWRLQFIDLARRKALFTKEFTGRAPEKEALNFLAQVRMLKPGGGVALKVGPISCKPTRRDSLTGRSTDEMQPDHLVRVYALPEATAEELTQNIILWSAELKTRLRSTQSQSNGFHSRLCVLINQRLEASMDAALAEKKGGRLLLEFEKLKGRNYSVLAYGLLPLEPGPSLVVWKAPLTGDSVPALDDAAVAFRSYEQLSMVTPVWPMISLPHPAWENPDVGLPTSLTVNVMCLKSQATPPPSRAMTSPDDALVCIMSAYQSQLMYQEIDAWSAGLKASLNATPESPNDFHRGLAKRINRYARTTRGISVSSERRKGRYRLIFKRNRRADYVVMAFAYLQLEEGDGMLVWERPYTGDERMTLHQGNVKQNSMDFLKPKIVEGRF